MKHCHVHRIYNFSCANCRRANDSSTCLSEDNSVVNTVLAAETIEALSTALDSPAVNDDGFAGFGDGNTGGGGAGGDF